MTVNYPLHVQERFERLSEQRAIQVNKAKCSRSADVRELRRLEHAENVPLSPADVDTHDNGVEVGT
jgi:hypothetical protein